MTKNSGRKKAARKYQQEHPGTTFPEAMRAVARPTTEPVSPPDGYVLLDRLDQDGAPVHGRLVNTSPEAFFFGSAGRPDYAEAKAGITALTPSVLTPSDKEAVSRSATMIASLIERLDAQDRGMLQRATSAVRAKGPQGSEYRWGKSTLNLDYRAPLFRDINDNGPVSLPGGTTVPENMKGSPAVAAAALEPTPGEDRTEAPNLEEPARQSKSTSTPE
ncbi:MULTISPECIES: hypothetical protein [Rhodococcus]|uniref:hypothetical protein n=1 Tax=Rhodococcus TaxID=1827 RepID=UPI003557CF43